MVIEVRRLMSRNSIVRGYPTVTVKDGTVIYLGGQYKNTINDILSRISEDGYTERDIVMIEDDNFVYHFNGDCWYKEPF